MNPFAHSDETPLDAVFRTGLEDFAPEPPPGLWPRIDEQLNRPQPIDSVFREAFAQYEAAPPPHLWQELASRLPAAETQNRSSGLRLGGVARLRLPLAQPVIRRRAVAMVLLLATASFWVARNLNTEPAVAPLASDQHSGSLFRMDFNLESGLRIREDGTYKQLAGGTADKVENRNSQLPRKIPDAFAVPQNPIVAGTPNAQVVQNQALPGPATENALASTLPDAGQELVLLTAAAVMPAPFTLTQPILGDTLAFAQVTEHPKPGFLKRIREKVDFRESPLTFHVHRTASRAYWSLDFQSLGIEVSGSRPVASRE